jgi:ubiquinone biosynthesis protein
MEQNISAETDVRVPAVNWELTGRDVLVTEWVDGTRLSNRAAVLAERPRPQAPGRGIVQSFLRTP